MFSEAFVVLNANMTCCESVLYLALDACLTAGAGLRLTEAPTVAAAGLPGEPQSVKLPLLLLVDDLRPRRQEESLSLFGRERLKVPAVLQIRLTNMNVRVSTQNLICRQLLRLVLVNGSTYDQLESNTAAVLVTRSFVSEISAKLRSRALTWCFSASNLS